MEYNKSSTILKNPLKLYEKNKSSIIKNNDNTSFIYLSIILIDNKQSKYFLFIFG